MERGLNPLMAKNSDEQIGGGVLPVFGFGGWKGMRLCEIRKTAGARSHVSGKA